jgi:glycosyltransferase involved in cell wall biosynthesis
MDVHTNPPPATRYQPSAINHPPPAISVILPVYNAAATVGRALASVARQTFSDYELIVVDDGSTDRSGEIIEKAVAADSRISYVRNERNLGIQKTLNRGLALAQGEYVARMDADDEWAEPEKLAQQVEFLERHPDYVICGTGIIAVDERGAELKRHHKPQSDAEIRGRILGLNPFAHPSVVFRADPVRGLGGYDESADSRHVEDYELWLRLGRVGKMANLPFYGLKYTVSGQQISTKNMLEQFRKNFALAARFRSDYPGYARAQLRNWLRLVKHGYLKPRKS